MHVKMKMDMSGAAAVLAAMTVLPVVKPQGEGGRVPDVHRQHAVGQRHETR